MPAKPVKRAKSRLKRQKRPSESEKTSRDWVQICLAGLFAAALFLAPLLWGRLEERRLLTGAGILLLLTSATGIKILRARQLPFRLGKLDWVILAWAIIVILGCFISANRHASLVGAAVILAYCGAYFMTRYFSQRRELLLALLGGIALGAVCCAGVGLRSYIVTVTLLGAPTWRIFGTFVHPNAFAAFLLLAIPLTLALGLKANTGLLKFCAWVCLVLLVAAIFLTGSKGGIMAALISGAVLGGYLISQWAQRRGRRIHPLLPLIGCLVVGAGAVMLFPPMRERFSDIFVESHSFRFRELTWLATLKMALARPFLGWGIGTFESTFTKFTIAGYTRMAHNDYLQVAAETGFIGLAIYLSVMLCFFFTVKKGFVTAKERTLILTCLAAGLAFYIHSLVDSNLRVFATGTLLWVCLGFISSQASESYPMHSSPRMGGWTKAVVGCLIGLGVLFSSYAFAGAYADARLSKGKKLLVEEGNFHAALAAYEEAISFAPLNGRCHATRARALALKYQSTGSTRDFWEAVREGKLAIALEPFRARNYLHLAEIYLGGGYFDAALSAVSKAIKFHPNYVDAYLLRAEIFFRRGQKEEALESLKRIIEIQKGPVEKVKAIPDLINLDFAKAHIYMARWLCEQGQASKAIPHLKSALLDIRLYGTSSSIYALEQAGQEPEEWEKELKGIASAMLGNIYQKMGEKEKSNRLWKEAKESLFDVEKALWDFEAGGLLP